MLPPDVDLACTLIRHATPSAMSNVEIARELQSVLHQIGFRTEWLETIDPNGVPKANLIGKRGPDAHEDSDQPGLAWFGHTDTVPVPEWFSEQHGAFEPTVVDGRLYGRGSCDMKGPIACFLTAVDRIAEQDLVAPIYVVLTHDEETGYQGAVEVRERSELYREMVERQVPGIIGEPTELQVVNAHKGGIAFRATSRGVAAHSSSRAGRNANLAMIPFLGVMKELHDLTESDASWQDDRFDPPVMSWNIGINDHNDAVNITTPRSVCTVYFRPMPDQDVQPLLDRVQQAATEHDIEIEYLFNGAPLWTDPESDLIQSLLRMTGQAAPQTVCYGTDGAVFNELPELAVIGPGSIQQAHTKDEFITLKQIDAGTEFYEELVREKVTNVS